MKCRKTILFGGSFDPIHKGHLHIMSQVSKYTDYERLIVMPANISAFKQDKKTLSSIHRLNMINIALEEFSTSLEILVSDIELKREGVSYTFDTVNEIYKNIAVDGKLGILIGSDIVKDLNRWKKIDELREIADFIVFSRDDEVEDSSSYTYIKSEVFNASSTEVRNGNLSILTKGVKEYARANGLF